MPAKKYRIKLPNDEREDLKHLISKGKTAARKITHAQILLHADEAISKASLTDAKIANALHI